MMSMERNKCKLCSRRFSSGRALGGHMRSHLATLPLPPKTPQKQEFCGFVVPVNGGGGDSTESTSSECFEEDDEVELMKIESEEKDLVYGLRENPKKSFKVVDPEFLDAGSVVQDRESETESTRKPTRRRSKRTRRMLVSKVEDNDVETKEQKMIKPSSAESLVELEPASSVSDTSPEEDLALCLIMLSRDVWSAASDESEVLKLSQNRRKLQCEICNRVFANSQALGSHKTSHKKTLKNCQEDNEGESEQQRMNNVAFKNADKKVHACPFCGKVFGSGQALGGHKRSHLLSSSTTTTPPCSTKFGGDSSFMGSNNSAKYQTGLMIDLNLPAPMEEEEASAVSDADFINPIKH